MTEDTSPENLRKFLESDDPKKRRHADEALGKIGDKRAVELLIKALEDEYGGVREEAAEALGRIGDKRAVEPLIKALEDKDVYFRECAAKALGEIGDKRAVEPLIKALEDEDVCESAKEALIKIGKKNIRGKEKDNVMKFLKSKDTAMVMMGASMLKGILEE